MLMTSLWPEILGECSVHGSSALSVSLSRGLPGSYLLSSCVALLHFGCLRSIMFVTAWCVPTAILRHPGEWRVFSPHVFALDLFVFAMCYFCVSSCQSIRERVGRHLHLFISCGVFPCLVCVPLKADTTNMQSRCLYACSPSHISHCGIALYSVVHALVVSLSPLRVVWLLLSWVLFREVSTLHLATPADGVIIHAPSCYGFLSLRFVSFSHLALYLSPSVI